MKRDTITFLCGFACCWLVGAMSSATKLTALQGESKPIARHHENGAGPQFPSRQLLDAMAFVESSNNPRAVSPAGARGLYQFMPATWGDVMTEPFTQAFDPVSSEIAAVRYLEWIRATLTKWKGSADVIDVLACWHGGIGRYKRRGYDLSRMPDSTRAFVGHVVQRVRLHDN